MQIGWGGSTQATSKVIRVEIVTESCVFSMCFESAKLVFQCDEINMFCILFFYFKIYFIANNYNSSYLGTFARLKINS